VTRDADIPYYVTDITKVKKSTTWQPKMRVEDIANDIHVWLQQHATALKPVFQL
jgi:CDP-paratose 2-epimerase